MMMQYNSILYISVIVKLFADILWVFAHFFCFTPYIYRKACSFFFLKNEQVLSFLLHFTRKHPEAC